VADQRRDYAAIARAGALAREGVWRQDLGQLAEGVRASYAAQTAEGMAPLAGDPAAGGSDALADCRPSAWKYCGGGHGGYALYLFPDAAGRDAACKLPGFRPIEPYLGRHD